MPVEECAVFDRKLTSFNESFGAFCDGVPEITFGKCYGACGRGYQCCHDRCAVPAKRPLMSKIDRMVVRLRTGV